MLTKAAKSMTKLLKVYPNIQFSPIKIHHHQIRKSKIEMKQQFLQTFQTPKYQNCNVLPDRRILPETLIRTLSFPFPREQIGHVPAYIMSFVSSVCLNINSRKIVAVDYLPYLPEEAFLGKIR